MHKLDLKIRLLNGADIAIGPGKADLLEAIREAGSISAAARQMSMSYRRAWLLVETMNHSFKEPLVSTLAGGSRGGGATLTALGEQVLVCYRALCLRAHTAAEPGIAQLAGLLRQETAEES
ncbi:winged helix-turn-helix domain-containing protein [Pseudomonas sp. N040]|uniref:winged helix-turn-helix domain-containing protein n=1 Tax=Pseudomonas sp. N040 TaxID=2785325 RepID=UPI0018A2C5DC|nr:LysR family transcriptional regulator [Pseudomonas sp. N040]MBF7729733.1 LysR family transcriptional regulator [Pseudomonas sp. N040]MBW7013375.1 LysR family transcriptional regulator [Pseudomonas sp. N040]